MRFVPLVFVALALAAAGVILVKLPDEQESYDIGGPAFPSSSYADPAVRPRLEVTFVSL
jgi:hypothetical protein